MESPLNRQLRWECEFACHDCQSILKLRTYLAIAKGIGQHVNCKNCGRGYRVTTSGAQTLPRDRRTFDGKVFPPPLSSLNVAQPPHMIKTLPIDRTVCYVCCVPVNEHPPEPTIIIPGR